MTSTMDGGEQAGADVVIEVLVLAHLKHFLPFLHSHLILHTLCSLIFWTKLLASKLNTKEKQQHLNILLYDYGKFCDVIKAPTRGLVGAT